MAHRQKPRCPSYKCRTAAVGRIRVRNGQGTPPAGPQPHSQTRQRVTREPQSPLSKVCPPKPRRLAPRPRPRKELEAKKLNAKGIEPEAPFRTPGPPKTRDTDQRHAKGRRQTRMGSSAALLLRGRREKALQTKKGPSRVPLSQVLMSRLPAPCPRNAPRGPAAP